MTHSGKGKNEVRKERGENDHHHSHASVRIKKEPEKSGYDDRPSHHHREERMSHHQRDERPPHRQGEERPSHHHRDRQEHREQQQDRRQNDRKREDKRRDQPDGAFGNVKQEEEDDKKPKDKDKPNFELSGKLTEDTNTFRGVVINYSEPPEARKPKRHWRLYTFKGDSTLPTLHIHRQSAYLMGRDRRVADIPIDHPSCSKQHAALQYRLVNYKRPDGRQGRRVRLYVIDLNSANGTYINNQRIESQKYVELLEKDVIKFGFSTREYVLLHDNTDTSELHEDEDDPGAE